MRQRERHGEASKSSPGRVSAAPKAARLEGAPPPGRGREKVAVITPATFVLMIIVGASPAQQRGQFGSYHDCYEAAQREVASRGADVRWDCLPKSRDREQE